MNEIPPQWQRWTITIPAGHHQCERGKLITTSEMRFDVYVPNLYPDEAAMYALIQRAAVDAYYEYGDPPATV